MDCKIEAVIFDLDGVIVSTDECHYEAWKQVSEEEGVYFDRDINERLRGVSRMESLEIILERSAKQYDDKQKLELTERKNNYYRELIQRLTPKDILPGVMNFIKDLKNIGIKVAIGSSSRNTPVILERIGLHNNFDVIVDGNSIKRSKPDPEVFLKGAEVLNIIPEKCIVIEDADAGVDAALAAGMRVLGVGAAEQNKSATFRAVDLSVVSIDSFL